MLLLVALISCIYADPIYINNLPYTINHGGEYILNTSCENLTTTAITINADNVVLNGNGRSLDGNGDYGIYMNKSNNVIIKNLAISGFEIGIYLKHTNGANITNIRFSGEEIHNIYFDNSNNSIVKYCNMNNNLFLRGICSNNTITNNTFLGNNIGIIFVNNGKNNSLINNTVNGKPIVYLENEQNKIIDNNTGQIIAVNCKNITVKDLSFSKVIVGIEFINVSNSKIKNIIITHCNEGIRFAHSSFNTIENSKISNSPGTGIIYNDSDNNNIITNSTFENCKLYGIKIWSSDNNTIYLNNFINNGNDIFVSKDSHNNTINSPMPITYIYNGVTRINYLGNYYSKYMGEDPNGDGIGDASYSIPYSSEYDGKTSEPEIQDNFPLIAPFENYIITNEERNKYLENENFIDTNGIIRKINQYQKNLNLGSTMEHGETIVNNYTNKLSCEFMKISSLATSKTNGAIHSLNNFAKKLSNSSYSNGEYYKKMAQSMINTQEFKEWNENDDDSKKTSINIKYIAILILLGIVELIIIFILMNAYRP